MVINYSLGLCSCKEINPFYTGNPIMGTLANSEEPNDYCLSLKKSSDKKIISFQYMFWSRNKKIKFLLRTLK